MPSGTQLIGGRELEIIRQENPLLGRMVEKIIDSINRTATNAGVSSAGELPPPAPIDSTQVSGTLANNVLSVPGEILHFVHTHNPPLLRGIQYITEVDTDPNFPNPHPIDTGSSRSGFLHLPTNDANGDQYSYYLRATPQLPGSAPQKPTVFGGLQGPTAIQMSGSTNMDLLTSQSGGTAKPYQGGQGLGKVLNRGAVGGPKRSLRNFSTV